MGTGSAGSLVRGKVFCICSEAIGQPQMFTTDNVWQDELGSFDSLWFVQNTGQSLEAKSLAGRKLQLGVRVLPKAAQWGPGRVFIVPKSNTFTSRPLLLQKMKVEGSSCNPSGKCVRSVVCVTLCDFVFVFQRRRAASLPLCLNQALWILIITPARELAIIELNLCHSLC